MIENLSVPELSEFCIERCQAESVECIVNCDNDFMCISDCVRESTKCTDGEYFHKCIGFVRETLYSKAQIIIITFLRLSVSN